MRYGRKKLRIPCGAIKKNGQPCQSKLRYKGGRCRHHGGLSLNAAEKAKITAETGRIFEKTGPKTPEGWNALKEGFRRYVERRRQQK